MLWLPNSLLRYLMVFLCCWCIYVMYFLSTNVWQRCDPLFCSLLVFAIFIKPSVMFVIKRLRYNIYLCSIPEDFFFFRPVDIHPCLIWLPDYSLYFLCFFVSLFRLPQQTRNNEVYKVPSEDCMHRIQTSEMQKCLIAYLLKFVFLP